MKNKCTVKGCPFEKAIGDSLFCRIDRRRWRTLCDEEGIEFQDIPDWQLGGLLKLFQERTIDKQGFLIG